MYIKFPKYLSIQTTSLCNGHCIFCPYDEIKNLFPKKIMDKELYKKIINEFRAKAKYLPKTDPYFAEMGCIKMCDNLMHNEEIYKIVTERR